MSQTAEKSKGAMRDVVSQLPTDRLKQEAQGLGEALGQKGFALASAGVTSLAGRLSDYASSGAGETVKDVGKHISEGDSPVKAGAKAVATKVKNTVGGKLGGSSDKKFKNFVESIDVPVSRNIAYEQWTQFEEFPTFMKRVGNVNQEQDEVVDWKAQIWWSKRTWKAKIVDQVPNERIVWKSDGDKGYVDGAVTFHEITPDLTRVLVTLEYHPKGLFEHLGNMVAAQHRSVRTELKHFRRHVATHTLLHPDDIEGWHGEIHDEHVTDSGDDHQQGSPEGSQESGNGESAESSGGES